MLYLARAVKKGFLGKPAVELLAAQRREYNWKILEPRQTLETPEANNFSDGVLVLAEIQNRQVKSLKDAQEWVLKLLDQYLSQGIAPNFMEEEVGRAEQWRQSLTLQSQDLARRAVELENRREQIQELEIKLNKREQYIKALEQKLRSKGLA